jgi:hypothetical protein
MKAKFVYESIGDILVGKDIDTVMKDIDVDLREKRYPPEFMIMYRKLVEMGYKPQLSALYDPDEMTKKTYTFRGREMDFHVGAYITIHAAQELEDMDHFYNDSDWREDAHIDQTSIDIMKLRDNGECIMDSHIKFDGYWPLQPGRSAPWQEIPHLSSKMIMGIFNPEEIRNATSTLVKRAEKFADKQVEKLKKYAQNW